MSKLTSALIGLGIVSFASAVFAANPVVYVTGSTAARGNINAALAATGQIFDSGNAGALVGGTAGGSDFVYEGPINGVTVDIDCHWSGSEAGIAAVAGQPLEQTLPLDPNGSGPYSLPGVPAKFLTQASGWTSSDTVANIKSDPNATPDIAMADTSQAVSQTPKSLYPLVDYGIVGIVTFTCVKGYDSAPTATYDRLVNITTAQANQLLGGPLNANIFTGNSADSTTPVVMTGRNFGSGTRANALLNFQYPINAPVDQFAWNSDYPSGNPGQLTFEGPYTSGGTLTEVGNDGFDGGGDVAKSLQVDASGSGFITIGYLGVGDAKHATAADNAAGHNAKYLTFNGVYEGDAAVIQGNYTYWGHEHVLGAIGQTPGSTAGQVAARFVSGIAANLASSGAGTVSGDVTTNPNQSGLIPTALMQVKRGGDGGFPTQGTY